MVALDEIKQANTVTASKLSAGPVAVFVGGTNGIGETTLKKFAKYAKSPKIYIVGRSKEAGDRVASECKSINSSGQYIFIKSDVSLLKNVDHVSRSIKDKEHSINLLFLSTGTLNTEKDTTEGLKVSAALTTYGRNRFAVNLLPLISKASGLRRVVNVFVGTKEGAVDTKNIQGVGMGMIPGRDHSAAVMTFSQEKLQEQYPTVSFVHTFPGVVSTGIWRDTAGVGMFVIKNIMKVMSPLISISVDESGERHFYAATNDKFGPSGQGKARGSNGKTGSGVYTLDEKDEPAPTATEEKLASMRSEGAPEVVWQGIQGDWQRILGSESI